MHSIDYGFKYPSIRAITDLQQIRDQGSVTIAFDRVGYGESDVIESNLYVYVGKCGEHTGWISDDISYGDDLVATGGHIIRGAFAYTSSEHFYPANERVVVPPDLVNLNAASDNTSKYFGSDIQSEDGDGGSILPGKYNGNKYYGKWRKVTSLTNASVPAYYAEGETWATNLYKIDAYTLQRNPVFKNPTNWGDIPSTVTAKPVLERFKESLSMSGYYNYRFGKFGENWGDGTNNTATIEVGLSELFYLSGGMYQNQYQQAEGFRDTVNLDFNPHTLQPEISSKDKGKLMYNILHGKTPMFFMIVEKLKKAHYGLTNFYFAPTNEGRSLAIVSSKKQAIEDMLYNAGDIIKTISVCPDGSGDTIQRVFVDLAQGNGYNPSYENNKRRVWVTTSKGVVASYDYWTGARKSYVEASTLQINAGAINPKTGEFVFVKVVGNTKSSFLQVCKIARDSSNIVVIANIPDYAAYTMPRYPMSGGYDTSKIAERITGGVIAKNLTGNDTSHNMWFTFIVNAENTISINLENSGTPQIRWVDRMHYGMWHGSNSYNIAKNKDSTIQQVKHGAYLLNKEYGVGANKTNVRGITTGVGGNVYVNGHTYLHYDDKKYKKYNTIGVHFKDQHWYYSGTEMDSCGHWFNYGQNDHNRYWSYDFDEDAGCWKKDANGYAVLVPKMLNDPGWPAGKLIFRVKDSNSGMTAGILGQIQSRLGKDGDGDHWCRMSWYASEFQSSEESTIKKMFETCGNFPPLKPGQAVGLVDPTGSSFVAESGTPNFGGSGYGCHMGSTEKKVSIQGGDKDYRPLNIGFLYNAESYCAGLTGDDNVVTNKRPVFAYSATEQPQNLTRGRYFVNQTTVSEDDPIQKGSKSKPWPENPSGASYDFAIAPGSQNPVPQDCFLRQGLVRNQSETSQQFANVFNYLTIDQPKYIDKSIVPDNNLRVGFCEDAHGIPNGQGSLHRWQGNAGNTTNSITAFSGTNERCFETLPSDINNTLYGLEECLPSNGMLVPNVNDGRVIYQTYVGAATTVNGNTGNGFRVVNYGGNSQITSASNITNMGLPSNFGEIGTLKTVYTDGTNGLWYEKDGYLRLETSATSADKYKIIPRWFRGDQITNLGHNKCSSPYFEHVAYSKDVTGVKYGYEQYAGAKELAVAEARSGQKKFGGLITTSLTVNAGTGNRYNDDPVGMRAIKTLGYCWTKSTKVHPTDVMPSGRLYVIDHYVIEDNPCKFMDKIYLDESRTKYDEIAVSSMSAASSEFITWRLRVKRGETIVITDDVGTRTFTGGEVITSGKYEECSATRQVMIDTWKGATGNPLGSKLTLASSFEMSAATIQRPKNGLPRVSTSFWDYSTDEGVVISGTSDEAAAVDAFEYLNMIKLPPMYLSDGTTIIGNPVSFRAAGYDKLYTAHLASIYDSGSYEIDKVSIWFRQNDDSDYTKNKAMFRSAIYGPTDLSSITIRDKEKNPTFGRDTILARSNKQLNGILNDSNVVYNHYRDTYCLSADNVWDSVNAYGKPQGSTDLSARFKGDNKWFSACSAATIGGHPLKYLYGQTCPRQWYGTEIYKYVNYVGSEDRISMMHTMSGRHFVGHHTSSTMEYSLPTYISGYGVHPSTFPEEASSLAFTVQTSGAMVENARYDGLPHMVGGSFTTNTYAYVDEREQPSAVTVDMGTNAVYVYERWPTQHWYPTCTDGRGGLELFGDCPDFEDD